MQPGRKTDALRDKLVAPLVMSHYRKMGVIPGWDASRFNKLCMLANRAQEEMGAFAGLEPEQTRAYVSRNKFPPPVSIHLAIFDATLREVRYGEPMPIIVPLDFLNE